MNIGIPKSSDGIRRIDYNRTGTSYTKMTDYVYAKGKFPELYLNVPGNYANHWYSDTVLISYSVYEGGGEDLCQRKSGVTEYTSANSEVCVRPSIDYSFIKNNGVCIQGNIYFRDKLYQNYYVDYQYSIYEYGSYPQSVAPAETAKNLEKLYNESKLSRTGNSYTYVNRIKNRDTFESDIEYLYNGEKYVRTKITFIGESFKSMYEDSVFGDYVWIKVEPITWIVDEKSKTATCEKVIIGPMKYNNEAKDGVKDTFVGNFLEDYFGREIGETLIVDVYEEKDDSKNESKNVSLVKTDLNGWLNWSNKNNIHPVIHMFMIGTEGIYLEKDIDWQEVSNKLYDTHDIYALDELLDEEVFSHLSEVYNSLNVTVDDVLNNNINEEEIKKLSNVKKYLFATLLTLIEENDYEYVSEFINEKLGKKYLKHFETLYNQCISHKNNKKSSNKLLNRLRNRK